MKILLTGSPIILYYKNIESNSLDLGKKLENQVNFIISVQSLIWF